MNGSLLGYDAGGGVHAVATTFLASQVRVSENTAFEGGGIYLRSESAEIDNCTGAFQFQSESRTTAMVVA